MSKHQISNLESDSRKRAKKHVEESDESEEEEAESKSEEEVELESEEETELIREARQEYQTQQRNHLAVAESGYLLSVELENFMCHEACKVELGSRMNFVVGNNGSGKSAILAGITMALGGTAKATDRGLSAKSTVRDGKAYAILIVKIANRGDGAFKHDIYGDVITIQRKVVAEGNGGHYKTKNVNGKTIGNQKLDVEDITDHFNLQVDNPLTVLTQASSKAFLTDTSLGSMYAFFLEGTQLKQLAHEYESITFQIQSMTSATDLKVAVLPELLIAYKKAKAAFTKSQAAIGQMGNLDRLKQEQAWAHIGDMEARIQWDHSVSQELSSRLPKYEQAIASYQNELLIAQTRLQEIDTGIEILTAQQVETNEAFIKAKDELKKATEDGKERRNEYRNMKNKLDGMKDSIVRIERDIETERRRLERDSGAENKIIMANISSLKEEKFEIEQLIVKANHELENIDNENLPARNRYLKLKKDVEEYQKRIQRKEEEIRAVSRGGRDPINVYSNDIQNLAREIKNIGDWREVPIGPIGMYIKVKDGQFSRVLESFFAAHLNAFIVTNYQDKQKLIRLASRLRCNAPIITQAYDETFDCRGGEPDQDYLTVRGALQYSNQLVEQVSIVSLHIEKMILVSKRSDGDTIMRFPPRNVQGCFSQDLFKVGGITGGSSTVTMPPWKGSNRLNADVAGRVRELEEERNELNNELYQIEQEYGAVNNKLASFTRQTEAGTLEVRKLNNKIKVINQRIMKAESSIIHDEESNLDQLEENKQESAAELASLESQIRPLADMMKQDEVDLDPLKSKRIEIETKMKGLGKALIAAERAKTEPSDTIYQNQSNITQYQAKIASVNEDLNKVAQVLANDAHSLSESIGLAETICVRPVITVKKSQKKLESEIQAIQKHLQEHNKKQGKTVEEITRDLGLREKVAADAKASIAALRALAAELQAASALREESWNHFRAQIAARSCASFSDNLAHRGMVGKLTFDHSRSFLFVKVLTAAAAAANANAKAKETNSLSGGEKSFSTISFLLTLWESVGSPLRCLDEYDVYMDSINRIQSVGMLIEGAKASPHVQFIVISPQSITGLDNVDPDLYKIVRMMDPRR